MASSTILTSTWSHNCGMHVIADFISEKLQQDDYKTIFTGKAYDKLLKSFQMVYQQKDLTWESIRANSFNRNRIDLQIIYGYALRMMLPEVVAKNTEYKQDLFNSFLAAMNLFKECKLEELNTTYPILYFACQDYFKEQALNVEVNSAEDLHYWNENGFENYCEALITILEESHSFLWLSKEELSIFCQYFNFQFEFVDHVDRVKWDSNKLYFSNESQTHWERKAVDDNATEPSKQMAPSAPSAFYECFFKNNSEAFFEHPKAVGEIFFSELYSEQTLGLDLYKNIQDDCLRKNLINKDSKALIHNILINKENKKTLSHLLEFGIVYFDYKKLKDWLKRIETTNLYPDFFPKILVGAVKYQKQEIFNQLLTDFPKEYHASACMPALILAAQQDSPEFAHQLLSRPDFDTNGLMSQAMSYVKPAFAHILNQFDENNVPALYYAIQNNNLSLASTLLEKGACATYKVNGRVAFEWALDTANLDMVDLLINTVSLNQLLSLYNNKGSNCFHLCFKNKALGWHLNKWTKIYLNDDLRNIIKEVLNVPNRQGLNVLHLSAARGYLEGIEYCLEHNMSLVSQDLSGNTALHLAAACGQLEAVKLLGSAIQKYNEQTYLQYNKFDLNRRNKHKRSPLHLANDNRHTFVAQYLQTIGCVDWVHDAYRELYLESQQEKPDFDAFCLKNKDKLNTQGSDDHTLLHFVCFLSNINQQHARTIIQKLVEHGAKVQATNHQGASSLHLAALHNNTETIEALLAQGAFIDAIDYQGQTACHYAVSSDAKEAFILLKDKGANLNLPAFPSSPEEVEPLTVAYVAEQMNGNIAVYLKPLKPQNVSDKPKVKFHSFEHQGLHWAESKLGMEHHYSNLCSELHGLEGSFTYQVLSAFKVGLCVAGASMIGPSAGAIEAVKQSILYLSPTLKQKAGQFYYDIKPGIHNYNLPYASRGLDITATGVSLAYNGLFKVMNYLDLSNNPGRRIVGGALGIAGVKAAQKLGAQQSTQAATLFLARELGYFAVDAYHASSPERKAHQASMQYHVNPVLNQAYEVWTSILGKDQAESLIQTAQLAVEWKANAYQYIGDSERALLDRIEGYTGLQTFCSNIIEVAFNNRYAQCILTPPQMLKLEVELKLNAFSEQTNNVLLKIEELIHTYLVPESEYQSLILHYAHVQKGLLIQNLKLQAEAQLKKAIESDNQQEIAHYEEKIKAYNESILASEQSAKEHYEQTAKGKIANEYNAAQQKDFQSWSDARDVDNLKTLDPDTYFDQAYADFGNKLSPEALSQYLISTFQMKKINFDDEAWENFKLNLDASKMHDADFKQNLKSQWSTFAKTEIQNHLAETTSDVSSDNPELEKLINDFKPYASPEELRVLELNQKIDVKIHQYNLLSEQKERYIKEQALIHAKYVNFLQANIQYEQAEADCLFAQANLEHLEFKINNEIEKVKNNPALTSTQKEKWIKVFNENLDDTKLIVQEKVELLAQKKTLLEQAEETTTKNFTLTEKYHFKNFSNQAKKHSDTANQYLQTEMQKALYDDKYEYETDEQQKEIGDVETKIIQLEQLNNYHFDYESNVQIS